MTGSRLLAEESNGNWWKILFFWGGGRELPPSPHTHTHSLTLVISADFINFCLFILWGKTAAHGLSVKPN